MLALEASARFLVRSTATSAAGAHTGSSKYTAAGTEQQWGCSTELRALSDSMLTATAALIMIDAVAVAAACTASVTRTHGVHTVHTFRALLSTTP
eukprot:18055-Heterococcus_DN1.PRE.7